MAHPQPLSVPELSFPYWERNSQITELARQYRENAPFPHICLADFLNPQTAQAIATEFPAPDTVAWTQYKHHNENKLGMAKRELFPPRLRSVADELNSPEFVDWLSRLTGIPGLIPDPSLPPRSKPVTPHGPTAWLEIKLREGKKRQIRHMTAAVGLFTLRLIRVAIGNIELDDLKAGEWRELTSNEINNLKK